MKSMEMISVCVRQLSTLSGLAKWLRCNWLHIGIRPWSSGIQTFTVSTEKYLVCSHPIQTKCID